MTIVILFFVHLIGGMIVSLLWALHNICDCEDLLIAYICWELLPFAWVIGKIRRYLKKKRLTKQK